MLKRVLLSACAAALVLAAPTVSEAQVRVGIGRGGYGYGGGYGGRNYNGYGGRNYGGYPGNYGRSGISIGIGTGYGSGYYGRGYYPSYYGGSYYSGGDYSPSVITIVPQVSSYQAFYPPSNNASTDGTASISVRVPANAQLWWNGSPGSTTGEVRLFRTAPVGNDGSTQRFQARWIGADGQMVNQTRDVQVMPNGAYSVDFFQPAQSANPNPTQTSPAPADGVPAPNAPAPMVPPPPAPVPQL